MTLKSNNIDWIFADDLVHFAEAFKYMELAVENIIAKKTNSKIWVLEHHPVITAGISASDNDLLSSTDIPIYKTNRGGKYTYHGPGMKIIYLMLDLKEFFFPQQPDISRFVEFLEKWVINVLKHYEISAEIRKNRVGLWVNHNSCEKKISAIGIKVKRWVSYHGIAINIAPDLSNFNHIVPCGIKDFGVVSLQELGIINFDDNKFNDLLKIEYDKLNNDFFAS